MQHPAHTKLRHNTYFFRYVVPADVRDAVGRREVEETLRTSDRVLAGRLAAAKAAEWAARVDALRGRPAAPVALALHLRAALAAQRRAGVVDPDAGEDLALEELPEADREAFSQVLAGRATPFGILVEDFLAQYPVEPRTLAMCRRVLERAEAHFRTLEACTRKALRLFLQTDPRARDTVARDARFLRQYWRFLEEREVIERADTLWAGIEVKAKVSAKVQRDQVRRQAFEPAQVRALWEAAEARGDAELGKAIRIAAYTGCRIEEVCSFTAEHRKTWAGVDCLMVANGKSEAARRLVPIHPEIAALVPTEGCLVQTETDNQYGERSTGIGKRFGRLKARMGYGPELVFHSIRKGVATQLEQRGVPEGIAADLLGHEKPTLSYGLYSSGSSVVQVREAVLALAY